MGYTKKIEIYQSTETVIYDEGNREVSRIENDDAHWYDTASVEAISDEEAEAFL